MLRGIAFTVRGAMNAGILSTAAQNSDVDLGITGYLKYHLFGHELYITTTHIALTFLMISFIILAIIANRAIKKADPNEVPGTFLNIVEFLVEAIDNLTVANMGAKHGPRFANYIGTLLIFIVCANMSGLLGLRPPTADYSTTFILGMFTFVLIHFNGFKYQKMGHITSLFKPLPLFLINIIGELATPLSLSLRLFGNILSGVVLVGLIYGLLPKLLLLVWPAALHVYFDVFSGAIQTYVFCMLTMVFISQQYEEE